MTQRHNSIQSHIYQQNNHWTNFSPRFLRPSLQLVFIFFQMYFVFLNQKMNIYRRKFTTRLGLMHLIATNLCVWLKVPGSYFGRTETFSRC